QIIIGGIVYGGAHYRGCHRHRIIKAAGIIVAVSTGTETLHHRCRSIGVFVYNPVALRTAFGETHAVDPGTRLSPGTGVQIKQFPLPTEFLLLADTEPQLG